MKIALHACCGPCLLEPFDSLVAEADEVVVVYANPNIHPAEEYERRRDTLCEHAAANGIRVVELPYAPERWLEVAGPVASSPADRCLACYRLRLGMLAEWAAENGFDVIATTLTVSPYQDAERISEAGRAAAAEHDIVYLERDFRERYPEATRRSRELGMYRQNYCGCLMSDMEARSQRAARKAARKAPKGA